MLNVHHFVSALVSRTGDTNGLVQIQNMATTERMALVEASHT